MNDYDLTITIPSRNEEFLNRTIQDILEHKKGKTQIIVGLDGQWPTEPIKQHPDVVVLFYPESIGQRAITNQCVNLSRAKYILKCDAHVAFDDGFDVKMMDAFKETGENVVMAPVMRNLHVFNWVCPDGHIRYQGTEGPCKEIINGKECGKETHKDIVWIPKTNPSSTLYCFDAEPHFQYANEMKSRQWYKDQGDLTESMSLQGSAFMMTRDKYLELNIGDETFGSWGSQGIQIACSFWLSGGRVLINHKTFYAHCFRTQGGTFGFPYPISGSQVSAAKKIAGNKLFENNWPRQIYPSSWLIDKFSPVTGWSETDRAKITEAGTSFINKRFEELRILGIISSIPSTMANHTTPMTVNGRGEKMAVVAGGLSKLFSSSTVAFQNILSVRDELKMGRITTQPIVTNMVKNWNLSPLTLGDGSDHPGIHKSMDAIEPLVDSNLAVSPINIASPIPAASNPINDNLPKNSIDGLGGNIVQDKDIGDVHNTTIPSRGCIYYTDNQLDEKVMKACQKQLWKAAIRDHKLPIVSCSLKPMDFGKNIVFDGVRGYLTMTKQILMALEALDTDIVYFCEHDDLYDKSHFDFVPKDKETWYYNSNYWMLRLPDGFAVQYNVSPLSGLVVYRETAIKHYRERIELMESMGDKLEMLRIGFEPYTHGRIDWKYKCKFETFQSIIPVIDISHGANVTKKRWSQDKFRRKPTFWKEVTDFQVPEWNNLKRLLG